MKLTALTLREIAEQTTTMEYKLIKPGRNSHAYGQNRQNAASDPYGSFYSGIPSYDGLSYYRGDGVSGEHDRVYLGIEEDTERPEARWNRQLMNYSIPRSLTGSSKRLSRVLNRQVKEAYEHGDQTFGDINDVPLAHRLRDRNRIHIID